MTIADAHRLCLRVLAGGTRQSPPERLTRRIPIHLFDRLLGLDRFTTERVLALCRDLPDADLDRDFDIGNRTIRRAVDHLLAAMELCPV